MTKKTPTRKVTLTEFLDLTKVIKMLYGAAFAQRFFEKNYPTYISNLNESLDINGKEQS